ncbi:MAG: hypothetical protein GY835_06665 [bacterium]|nr:hypothetical protein [bacterium]
MIPAIVVCHGTLGRTLCSAAEGIWGQTDRLIAVSNNELCGEGLRTVVADHLDALGGQAIIFTDYFGGSCATACLAVMLGNPRVRLVSGVNLPILIYYLTHRHELEFDDLVAGIIHRGQNSIRELTPPEL